MTAPASADELLPATRRAPARRVAAGRAEGRTPSLAGAVVRDGRHPYGPDAPLAARPDPDGWRADRYIGCLTSKDVKIG